MVAWAVGFQSLVAESWPLVPGIAYKVSHSNDPRLRGPFLSPSGLSSASPLSTLTDLLGRVVNKLNKSSTPRCSRISIAAAPLPRNPADQGL